MHAWMIFRFLSALFIMGIFHLKGQMQLVEVGLGGGCAYGEILVGNGCGGGWGYAQIIRR